MADGESLRDYFIRFLFQTDKEGVNAVQKGIGDITSGLDRASKRAFEFNEKMEAIRKLTQPFRMLANMVQHTAEEAAALNDLSARTGVATEKLEQLGYMAELNGTSAETLTGGMRVLEKQMGGVIAGGKEQTEMFAKLGISVHRANGKIKTVDELLPDVSAALQKLPSHAQKSAYAMELFGRSGQDLLPMLSKGPEAIREMQEELAQLGGVTSDRFLESASQWDEILHKLTATWRGIRQAISGPILDAMNRVAGAFIAWWKASGELTRSKLGEWARQLVDSLESLWHMLSRLAVPLIALVALLNAPLLVMVGMRAMIALLIDDFNNWVDGNDSLIGRAIANWDEWLMKLGESHPVLAGILSYFGDFVQWVHDHVIKLGTDWEEFLANVTDDSFSVGDVVKNLFKSIGDFMLAPITETWDHLKNFMFDTLIQVKDFAKSIGLDGIAETIGGAAASLMNGKAAEAASDGLSMGLSAVGNGLGAMVGIQPTMRSERMPPSIAGPSSSPTAAATREAGSGGAMNVDAPITMNITAPEGMDVRALADQVGKQIESALDSAIRTGYDHAVPERY